MWTESVHMLLQGLALWASTRRWSDCMHIQNGRLPYTRSGRVCYAQGGTSVLNPQGFWILSCIYLAFCVAALSRYT